MGLRRRGARGAALGLVLLAADPAGAAAPDALLGRWLTRDGDGVFAVERCGDMLCGRLVGMRYKGTMPLDNQGRPQCGQRLLNGFRPAGDEGRWSGTIRNPDNGRSYDATIWTPAPGVLKLHGYLLLPIFGQTQRWTRYRGPIGIACKLPG